MNPKNKNQQDFWRVIGLVVFVNLAICGVWFSGDIIYSIERAIRKTPFDAAVWKATRWDSVRKGENRTRDYMVGDLLAKYKFIGWKKEAVVELLGEPTSEKAGWKPGLTYAWYRIDGHFDNLIFIYSDKDVVVEFMISYD